MRTQIYALLFVILPALAPAQVPMTIESHGEQIWLQEVHGDTLTFRGQDFGIASGPDQVYRWVVTRDGALYGVYLGWDGDPFLWVVLPASGTWTVVRYTDYYTAGVQTGCTVTGSVTWTGDAGREYKDE